ncbi:hypothetical protein NIES4073_62610 [Kalymmatonema gypsitolerans NIES-4073]|nr:hypothetical protein NIES4073_62610 [Scytonema sp. NIES-4073]
MKPRSSRHSISGGVTLQPLVLSSGLSVYSTLILPHTPVACCRETLLQRWLPLIPSPSGYLLRRRYANASRLLSGNPPAALAPLNPLPASREGRFWRKTKAGWSGARIVASFPASGWESLLEGSALLNSGSAASIAFPGGTTAREIKDRVLG